MTNDSPSAGVTDQQDLVRLAEQHFGATARTLAIIIDDIEAGRFGPAKELSATISALRKALEAVFSERARLERLGAAGGPRAGELDLDAARSEITRRMDRLRASADPRELL